MDRPPAGLPGLRAGRADHLPADPGLVENVADRLAPGRSAAFRLPGDEDPTLAVRPPDGSPVGYSAVRTHLACAVLWRADRGADGQSYRPCHEGVFDSRTGGVAAGPPPRPLPRVFPAEDPDGSIWALATARSGEPGKGALCRQIGEPRDPLARRPGCPGAAGTTGRRRT
ncbi:Rieske (2Fe-2S) protein [Streptomyces sp. HUAS TT3]|uniref:Rieske (2Fe-2S) protein n=1 Tax=Streptomyces sp. HUAS TT3 TaxID=3447510 RepID=UPI003F65C4CD